MKEEKVLYHYTSKYHMELIMKAGYLKLTPSDLIKPVDLRLVKGEDGHYCAVSELSDSYKPVVWLTDSTSPEGQGLDMPYPLKRDVKKRIRIVVPMKDTYKWWVSWAEKNRMNKKWFKDYIRDSRYGTWYVSEEEIKLEDVLFIEDLETGEILLDHRKVA